MSSEFDFDDYLSRLDISAIESPKNKIAECEFFLSLASQEINRDRFRWLISAFFGAAYSYFEMSALSAYFAFTAPDTGDPIEDEEALGILRAYVEVLPNPKRPSFVKTAGKHPTTKKLYELRRASTHHAPLSIMAADSHLPEDFQFGRMKNEGIPALPFCREALALIQKVQGELEA